MLQAQGLFFFPITLMCQAHKKQGAKKYDRNN